MASPASPASPEMEHLALSRKASNYVRRCHSKVPGVRRLPFAAVAAIAALVLANLLVWAAVGVILRFHTPLAWTAVLSYSLGLRHALDADHISVIDLMTRRLIASGQRPVTVGLFFSLGHSTIVIVTSIVVAATASAVSSRFGSFSRVGGVIGTSISAAVLLLLGAVNLYILYRLITRLRRLTNHPLPSSNEIDDDNDTDNGNDPLSAKSHHTHTGGPLFTLLSRLFKLISQPWKMYPLGLLFGLGFDTSSEVALLGIASIQGTAGTSLWLILIFPLLFTAGMALIDTADGALMMGLYTSTRFARDAIAMLYYSVVLTGVTVVVAGVVGTLQVLSLVANVADVDSERGFWKGVVIAGEYYDVIGGAICGAFVVFGVASVLLYPPWRREVDRRMEARRDAQSTGEFGL